MKAIPAIFMLTWLAVVSANADVIMPKGCAPLPVQESTVMLPADKPMLYLLYNTSTTDLWVTHPITNPGASAGWTTRLQAGKWSALQLAKDKSSFELSCIESKPGHEQQTPCSGVLAVCAFKGVKAPANQNSGSYWAGEDMSLEALKTHIGGRGFVLPLSD